MPSNEQIKKAQKYFRPGTGCPGGCIEAIAGVKDATYDQMLRENLDAMDTRKLALNKIGLDEDQLKEIPPIFFHGYNYGDNAMRRLGKDGRLRSSKYDTTWIFFSDTQVYMYKHVLDMASSDKKERTEEYFYRDITNFSTLSETVKVGVGKSARSVETHTFAVIVPGDRFECSISNVPDADRSIGAMKQKLREKKA